MLAAPTISDQRGSRHGADVQIGGGVRVGDAFQAIVGPRPVAIRVTENCVQISQARFASPVTTRENGQGDGKCEEGGKAPSGQVVGVNEYSGVTGLAGRG